MFQGWVETSGPIFYVVKEIFMKKCTKLIGSNITSGLILGLGFCILKELNKINKNLEKIGFQVGEFYGIYDWIFGKEMKFEEKKS